MTGEIRELNEYQKKYQEDKVKQTELWKSMVESLFAGIPAEVIKESNKARIVKMLNTIGKNDNKIMNHMFYPSGGGNDLTGAALSHEEGRIELHFGGIVNIVNPESLTFHPIGDNPEWWYFRLNTAPFAASGVYEEPEEINEELKFYGEEVLEVAPGEYVDRGYRDMGYLGEDEDGKIIPLPKGARGVTRNINGGAFVLFPKLSIYNEVGSSYDGDHNKVTDEDFHKFISEIVNKLEERK